MEIKISIRRLTIWLAVITVALHGISFVGRAAEHLLGYEETTRVVRLFHVNEEANIPSYFSALLLLFSALLLAVIARWKNIHGDPYQRHWKILSAIFVYLSLDEAAMIHEITTEPMRSIFGAKGIFYYSWVIIAIPVLLLLALYFFRFVFALPLNTRLQIIAAGGLFIMGALGMELLEGYFHIMKAGQWDPVPYLVSFEEFLENVGTVVFIYALTSYLKSLREGKGISIEFV